MEQSQSQPQSTNTKGYKIAIVLLTIIAIAGVGFGVFGMLSKSSEKTDATPETKPASEQTQPTDNKDERYQAFLNNLSKTNDEDTFSSELAIGGDTTMMAFIEKGGRFSASTSNPAWSGDGNICDDTDVVVAFVGRHGQALPVVYYIKKTGELFVCTQSGKDSYETKKIENAKYIIGFRNGYSDSFDETMGNTTTHQTYLIDIDGNIIPMPNDFQLK